MFKPELWQSHNEYRTIVSIFGRRLSRNNPKYCFDSYDEERQKIFSIIAVPPSVQFGLIDPQNLTLSGDDSAVVSHSSPYGRHLSSCNRSCPCLRHYSDPNAG